MSHANYIVSQLMTCLRQQPKLGTVYCKSERKFLEKILQERQNKKATTHRRQKYQTTHHVATTSKWINKLLITNSAGQQTHSQTK